MDPPIIASPSITPAEAYQLRLQTATLCIINSEKGLQLSFDYLSFVTGDQFMGIKHIPPGPHLLVVQSIKPSNKQSVKQSNSGRINLSINQSNDEQVKSIRWFYTRSNENIVFQFNKQTGELEDIDQSTYQSINQSINQFQLDHKLGPYQSQHFEKWRSLTSSINQSVIEKVNQRQAHESITYQPKYNLSDKQSNKQSNSRSNSQSNDQTNNQSTAQSMDQSNNQPDSQIIDQPMDQSINRTVNREPTPESNWYTPIPSVDESIKLTIKQSNNQSINLSPAEVTDFHFDHTHRLINWRVRFCDQYTVNQSNNQSNNQVVGELMIGEFQHCFASFLIGEDLFAFNQWKDIIILLSDCNQSVNQSNNQSFHRFWLGILSAFESQLFVLPLDWFIDDQSVNSFMEHFVCFLKDMIDDQANSQSINQSNNQSMDQSDDYLIDQSINHSIKRIMKVMKERFDWEGSIEDEYAPTVVI